MTSLVVLDTNIVLDLFVYKDPLQAPLHKALQNGDIAWLATTAMREELTRVLGYPQIAQRMAAANLSANDVVARVDELAKLVEPAPKAPYTCKDPDDQIFIDLACAHQCLLLSKDKAVLAMRSRLARLHTAVKVTL